MEDRVKFEDLTVSQRIWLLNRLSADARQFRERLTWKGFLTKEQLMGLEQIMESTSTQTPSRVDDPNTPLFLALDRASKASGKNACLHINGFRFLRAGDDSKNPKHIYVLYSSQYLGKIYGRKIQLRWNSHLVWSVDDKLIGEIPHIIQNPIGYALQSGADYGICAGCGKHLPDGQLIGKSCAARFGWEVSQEEFGAAVATSQN